MASAWELLSSERQGQVGRRALVAKTFRMPDGSEQTFTVTEFAAGAAAAVVALTVRGTVVLAEQYRPGPERLMAELPGGAVDPRRAAGRRRCPRARRGDRVRSRGTGLPR